MGAAVDRDSDQTDGNTRDDSHRHRTADRNHRNGNALTRRALSPDDPSEWVRTYWFIASAAVLYVAYVMSYPSLVRRLPAGYLLAVVPIGLAGAGNPWLGTAFVVLNAAVDIILGAREAVVESLQYGSSNAIPTRAAQALLSAAPLLAVAWTSHLARRGWRRASENSRIAAALDAVANGAIAASSALDRIGPATEPEDSMAMLRVREFLDLVLERSFGGVAAQTVDVADGAMPDPSVRVTVSRDELFRIGAATASVCVVLRHEGWEAVAGIDVDGPDGAPEFRVVVAGRRPAGSHAMRSLAQTNAAIRAQLVPELNARFDVAVGARLSRDELCYTITIPAILGDE